MRLFLSFDDFILHIVLMSKSLVMTYSWKLKIFSTWDEVDDPAFLAQWQQWIDSAADPHVFFHPLILKAWTDTYRLLWDITPLYCVAYTDDITVFLPLVVWRKNWNNAFVKVIVPAGYSDYDYHDPVVVGLSTMQVIRSFWNLIQSRIFDHGSIDYDQIDLLGIAFPGRLEFWKKEEVCPFIDLKKFDDFQQYFQQLGKNLRKDLRRSKRMLEEYGSLSFHVYAPNELQGALQVLPIFLETHTRKWPSAFKAPGFHKGLLLNGLPTGLVHFSEIRIDNVPISWELGFRYKHKAYSYMPAYQEEYAKYSPGKLQISYILEDCFKRGQQIFDYMRGAEEYKGEWTDSEVFIYRYLYNAKGFQSRVKILAYNALNELKKIPHYSPLYIPFAYISGRLFDYLIYLQVLLSDSYEIFMADQCLSILG
jgi:hypothetical protein